MNLFRITACVLIERGEFTCTKQVPQFLLDGDCHGIFTEDEAVRFAERMLEDVGDNVGQVSAIAVREKREDDSPGCTCGHSYHPDRYKPTCDYCLLGVK